MKAINDFENVKANGEYDRLPAGAYECIITEVEDVPGKEYLKLEYDIVNGDYKGYWTSFKSRAGWTGGKFIRSYKNKALGMFKAFTNAVEGSNAGYKWDFDENKLVGKKIGLVLGEENYDKNDGSIGTRLYVHSCKSIQDIREGKYKVPEFRARTTAPTPSKPVFEEDNSDLPF